MSGIEENDNVTLNVGGKAVHNSGKAATSTNTATWYGKAKKELMASMPEA
jgi:hypothetical protein